MRSVRNSPPAVDAGVFVVLGRVARSNACGPTRQRSGKHQPVARRDPWRLNGAGQKAASVQSLAARRGSRSQIRRVAPSAMARFKSSLQGSRSARIIRRRQHDASGRDTSGDEWETGQLLGFPQWRQIQQFVSISRRRGRRHANGPTRMRRGPAGRPRLEQNQLKSLSPDRCSRRVRGLGCRAWLGRWRHGRILRRVRGGKVVLLTPIWKIGRASCRERV